MFDLSFYLVPKTEPDDEEASLQDRVQSLLSSLSHVADDLGVRTKFHTCEVTVKGTRTACYRSPSPCVRERSRMDKETLATAADPRHGRVCRGLRIIPFRHEFLFNVFSKNTPTSNLLKYIKNYIIDM